MSKYRLKRLTSRQREVFDFIESHIFEHGFPPILKDIGKHFGFSEKASTDHVAALIKKGYIEQQHGKARTLRLTDKSRLFSITSPNYEELGIEKGDILTVSPAASPIIGDRVLTPEGRIAAFEGQQIVGKVIGISRQL